MTTSRKPAAKSPATRTATASKAAARPATRAAAKPATRAAAKPAAKSAAKPAKPVKEEPKLYVMLTGVDDAVFCSRVSQKIKDGYELYGSPSVTFNGKDVIAAQALVLKKHKKGKK